MATAVGAGPGEKRTGLTKGICSPAFGAEGENSELELKWDLELQVELEKGMELELEMGIELDLDLGMGLERGM
eukprot:gene27851-34408_t